jgi:hypothetical protein
MAPLSADSPYEQLVAVASPVDRAVLERLSKALALAGSERAREARELAEESSRTKKRLGGELRRKSRELSSACKSIKRDLVNRWPELDNPGQPRFAEILANEAGDVAALIESHPSYSAMAALAGETDLLDDEKSNLDRRWAKCQRLIRALENVALAHNLPLVAAPEVQQRYQRLLESERGVFGQQIVPQLTATN